MGAAEGVRVGRVEGDPESLKAADALGMAVARLGRAVGEELRVAGGVALTQGMFTVTGLVLVTHPSRSLHRGTWPGRGGACRGAPKYKERVALLSLAPHPPIKGPHRLFLGQSTTRAGGCEPKKAKLAKAAAGLVEVSMKLYTLPSTTALQGYVPVPPTQGMPRKRLVLASPALYPSISPMLRLKGEVSPAPRRGFRYGPREGGFPTTKVYTQWRAPEEGVGVALPWAEPVGAMVPTVGVGPAEAAELVAAEEGLGAALPDMPGRVGGRLKTRGKKAGSLSTTPVCAPHTHCPLRSRVMVTLEKRPAHPPGWEPCPAICDTPQLGL